MPESSTPDRPPAPKQFRSSRLSRAEDAVMRVLVRLHVVPRTSLLTTRGRKSGRPRTNPATVVAQGRSRWLVSPYGVVSWVHNVRADGRVVLHRLLERQTYLAQELPAQDAAPILREYVRIAPATRPYFAAAVDAPVEEFAAEADRHPVFALVPAGPHRGG
ncbi:nitroreductase family deazaflavin-dependent oxidoreductase [Isoptericola sp. S6320L]|uniref:nitroreductase family deazaflavin-dependent oxidoreductase n=1 Tax=Isoptericola sp. S6320L TaxID=2926411 RepID=UPI001FF3781A|nr:nitroreductase family deazaflavin-dependent oxidoreductase [Isoptericola sp. S6320L]MCK0116764.1 nitroreductase family deazaflavin-dependent oxidoreductase [Isoptericola sp. S6320L]